MSSTKVVFTVRHVNHTILLNKLLVLEWPTFTDVYSFSSHLQYSTLVSHETFGPSLMYLCHPQTVGSAISYLGQSHGSRVSFKVLGSAIKQLGHP